jgi:hypothetical protein
LGFVWDSELTLTRGKAIKELSYFTRWDRDDRAILNGKNHGVSGNGKKPINGRIIFDGENVMITGFCPSNWEMKLMKTSNTWDLIIMSWWFSICGYEMGISWGIEMF